MFCEAIRDDGTIVTIATAHFQPAICTRGGRGKLFKLDRNGRFEASYDVGWDVTPAIHRHDGTYSIILKDVDDDLNFYMAQLDAQLQREWRFEASNTQSCRRSRGGSWNSRA